MSAFYLTGYGYFDTVPYEREFDERVDDLLQRVAEHPRTDPVVYRGLRRAVFRHFPYGLYFTVNEPIVTIVACLHGKRRPRLIRDRIL